MATLDIIRAWKDGEYRESLSAEQRALLPEHPAGALELTDAHLAQVVGGANGVLCTGCSGANSCGSSAVAPSPESGILF